ncbi:NAD(P)H-dependent glycerol-3-phosphate dehydrogenase [Desulfurobacterium indicum]|uniref:Glycerol-3-phosphate dehydrogenase [NAD(P)+] n=1 Tax=Desulfurobacterium indicum TaxID=1914305 RepID=A0A1R1MNQ4_9BACT|nr:NAD(P)H-dependent glycerol-3-phosphate dehydrogenase [Desulfurobacterium indicum]OMH41393.1 glycerol-3-phosphate dehydrogenase [Desulfurobacterium indicum]
MVIGILGSGSWGSALSIHFGNNGFNVIQWCREKEVADSINRERENRKYLSGVPYPESVRAVSDIEEFFAKVKDIVFSVIPAQFTGDFWKANREYLVKRKVICASKGIEISSLKLLSQVYAEVVGGDYFVLSGPTFAREVAFGKPTAAVLAGKNIDKTFEVVNLLNTKLFRLYASDDLIGVETGGAMKNVIAIAAGISDGMELGNNARAALITRGLHEIKNLGVRLGGKEKTFYGLSGMGDLILTCTGNLSRNRQFGLTIGRGEGEVDKKYVVEGVHTVKAAVELSKRLNVEMPITRAVYAVLYEGKKPSEIMLDLLSRPVKEE